MNDHHITELLRLNHGICLSRLTVQRLLRAAGLPSPRRRWSSAASSPAGVSRGAVRDASNLKAYLLWSLVTDARVRKRIEEIFGRLKTVALMRKVRHRGTERFDWMLVFTAAVYNLVRLRSFLELAA